MRALLAVSTADRISHTAIVLAGTLCGILVFFVAIPLALSSPYPSPKDGEWIIHRSSLHVASAISLPRAAALPSGLDHNASGIASSGISWSLVSLPVYEGASLFVPAETAEPEVTYSIASASSTEVKLDPTPAPAKTMKPEKRAAGALQGVDAYLWEVYRRAPVKKDGAGDFTWKDPAAAKRFGLPMPAHVIGGL